MYTTCAFCGAKFDGDGGPSGLGVGRRLAFDEWRGRLWVVCPKCARWNLTPLDDRLERIEALARSARVARLLANTEQVSLLRWEQYDLIRVGKPMRVELAGWRYGERLRARNRERAKVVVPLTLAAVGLGIAANVAVGGSFGFLVWNFGRVADSVYVGLVGNRRVTLVEPPICERCGTLLQLKSKHIQHARVIPDAHHDLGVLISCPSCHREAALLTGVDAQAALRQGLAFLNVRRSSRRKADDAARVVDQAGGPDRLIQDVARRELTLRSLRPERQLALEMAVDEQAEVQELERHWREAEEQAEIADGTLSTSTELEEELRRLKRRAGDQPPG
jgi:nitrate reductase NapE component